jgi:hypothetical protein
MDKAQLLEKINASKREMGEAETDLEKVLRELRTAPRAEKTTISKVVEDAFAKLRAARKNLIDLERLISED